MKMTKTVKARVYKAADLCPVFRNQLIQENEFTKFWIMLPYIDKFVDKEHTPIFLKPIERYMAHKINLLQTRTPKLTDEEIKDLLYVQSNGMTEPVDGKITNIDRMAIKDALGINLGADRDRYDAIRSDIRVKIDNYINADMFMKTIKTHGYVVDKDLADEMIAEYRQTGWFDDVKPSETYVTLTVEYDDFYEDGREKVLGFVEKEDPDAKEKAMEAVKKLNEKDDKKSIAGKTDSSKKKSEKTLSLNDDELVNATVSVIDKLAPAGDSEKFINSLMNDGTREVFSGSIIDIAKSIIKGGVSMNFDGFKKVIDNIEIDKVDFTKSSFKNIGRLVAIICEAIKEIKNADDIGSVLDIVERTAKDVLALFEDKEFVKDLKKLLGKIQKDKEPSVVAEIPAKEVTTKESEPAPSVKNDSKDEQVAAMNISKAFPTIAAVMNATDGDDGIPTFCRIDEPTSRSIKEVPSFIQEAMRQEAPKPIPRQPNATYQIEKSIMDDPNLGFVPMICQLGVACGVTTQARSIVNGGMIVGIQFVGFTNGNWNWMKSFSVDLGQIVDNRIKVFFNCTMGGFNFMEACDCAYGVFSKSGEFNADFFKEVFTVGTEGLSSESIKKYRLFNSNMLQLNRIIEYRSVSDDLGDIGKENRLLVKDSLFKMMRIIKDMSSKNGIPFGRFCVQNFDKESLHYELSNIDMGYCGKANVGPRTIIDVVFRKDNNGKAMRDKDGAPKLTFSFKFIDNVVDIEKLIFPNDADVVEVGETDTTEE